MSTSSIVLYIWSKNEMNLYGLGLQYDLNVISTSKRTSQAIYSLMKCDMLLIRLDIYYTPVFFSVSGIWDLV